MRLQENEHSNPQKNCSMNYKITVSVTHEFAKEAKRQFKCRRTDFIIFGGSIEKKIKNLSFGSIFFNLWKLRS